MTRAPSHKTKDEFLQRMLDFIFGYDFFISYSHADGPNYPKLLKEQLEKSGFTIFLDQTEYVAGLDLRRETRRQVRKSRKIVVVGRAAALKSEWVRREVDVALASKKTPIIININAAIEASGSDTGVAEMARSQHWLHLKETISDPDGSPSDKTVAELIRSFNHTRQETKRQRTLAMVAAILAIATGIAAWQAVSARYAEMRAKLQLDKALYTQSLFLSDLANQRIRAGDTGTALALAIEALPDEHSEVQRPYAAESEVALFDALDRLNETTVLTGHRDIVLNGAFSPDGRYAVTASRDKTVRIWDVDTGKTVSVITEHGNGFVSAMFSADGERLVSASTDGTAKIWNISTDKPSLVLMLQHQGMNSAAFCPNGKRVATASEDNTARIWDAENGHLMLQLVGHTKWVKDAEFSPDCRQVVTASWDESVRIWDAETGSLVKTLQSPGQLAWFDNAAFSPDGKRVVASGHFDFAAHIWDVETGQQIRALQGHENAVHFANFSPDGSRIVTASFDNLARIWDSASGSLIATLAGHEGFVMTAVFSRDGKHLLTTSLDGTARIWKADTGRSNHLAALDKVGVHSAAFSPDGQRIYAVSLGGGERVLDSKTGQQISALKDLAYTDDRRGWLLIGAAFKSDGDKLVISSEDNTVRIFDASTRESIADLKGHTEHPPYAVFSSDGRYVVTCGGLDKTARVWEVATGKAISVLAHDKSVVGAAFSPDGKRVVTGSDEIVRIWDAQNGKLLDAWSGHLNPVNRASFSPDGRYFATASVDHTARIWDANAGKTVMILEGHTAAVLSATFSSDGRRVATTSQDNTARVWDVETGNTIAILNAAPESRPSSTATAVFSPDGRQVITAFQGTHATVWSLFSNTQEILDYAKKVAPRCLGRQKRRDAFLNNEPPAWCIDLEKWPYNGQDWKEWLNLKRRNENPPAPKAPDF